jgi:uncharacterized cofD-like protein
MAGRVRRVWLEPNSPPAFPPAVRAILKADLIVVGPGSVYTSLLPNLLVPDLQAALHASHAIKAYVCNIATQVGETDLFACHDHVRALEEHAGEDLFDVIVCNDRYAGELGTAQWVRVDESGQGDPRLYRTDLADVEMPWRHDAARLASVLLDVYFERTGPLSS